MGIFIGWIVLCFLVAITGKYKKIGYWGVFFLSLLLSPLIGLIIGLASKPIPPVPSYNCGKCKMTFQGRQDVCPHCGSVQEYADTIYTCGGCQKSYKGKMEACPHCGIKQTYKKRTVEDIEKEKQAKKQASKAGMNKDLMIFLVVFGVLILIVVVWTIIGHFA